MMWSPKSSFAALVGSAFLLPLLACPPVDPPIDDAGEPDGGVLPPPDGGPRPTRRLPTRPPIPSAATA